MSSPGDREPERRQDDAILVRGGLSDDWSLADPGSLPPSIAVALPRAGEKRGGLTFGRLMAVLTIGIFALLLFRASVQSFRADGVSMAPALHDGDYLVVNKLAYGEVDFGVLDWAPFWDSSDHHWARPVYGDVIVFDSPTDEGRFVKRVIGMPGDEMLIEGGAVTRNGEPLSEPYAIGDTQCFRTCGPWIVPAEHYFVLGDNRENSIDSREGWTVSLGAISGKVVWHR